MRRSKERWIVVMVGILLWVLVVYPAYYVVHKPLSLANLRALANVAADLFTFLLMFVVALALGSRLTRRIEFQSQLERFVFSTGLGLSVLSLLTFGLALVGLLYGWLLWTLLLVAALALWKELLLWLTAVRRARIPWPKGIWSICLSLFVLVTLSVALLTTLLPPVEWDSWVYHLVGPERYLEAHRLTFDLDNYYLFFPSFVEMLFTAGMALKSDVVARLVHLGYLVLTLGALGAFTFRYWQRRSGLLAVALFLSIPTAVLIATWSYVDLALTFYSFLALYALLNWLSSGQPPESVPLHGHRCMSGWLALAGLSAGAAMSIKYTGIVTLLVLAAVLIWSLVRRRLSFRCFVLGGTVISVLALLVVAPWYAKNAIVTGNPIYPLVWGGRGWNDIATRWLQTIGQEMSFLELLILPWSLTVLGTQGSIAFDSTYSPLFLMLLPLLLIVDRKARGLGELLIAAAVGYAFWLAAGMAAVGTFVLRGRQLLPIFAPLSLLSMYALEGLGAWERPSFSMQRILKVLVTLTLALALLSQIMLAVALQPWPYIFGYQSRQDYLDQHVPQRLHQTISYLNQNLTAEDKVLFIWELRGYGLQVPHEADTLLDNFSQLLARYGSAEGVAVGLREEGFTHLLVNEFIFQWIPSDYPITPDELSAWETFQKSFLTDDTLIHEEEDYLKLYRLVQPEGL